MKEEEFGDGTTTAAPACNGEGFRNARAVTARTVRRENPRGTDFTAMTDNR